MRKLALYIWYFLTSETKELRQEAQSAALAWCKQRHTYHFTDQYRIDFQSYMRAYINSRCHDTAISKLSALQSANNK